jgi:integrase
VKPKLLWNILAAFRAFLRWCRRRVPDLTMSEFPAVAVPQHPNVKVSPKTRRALLAAVPEPRRGAFLAAALGIRPGEVRALDVGDYDAEERELTIARAMKTPSAEDLPGPTKGLRCRTLPVPDELHAWITRYRAEALGNAPLFLNPTGRSGDRRWNGKTLAMEWMRACREVGVEVPMYEALKHGFATELVERGVDLGTVQRFLGHADRHSTDHCTHRATRGLVHVLKPRQDP